MNPTKPTKLQDIIDRIVSQEASTEGGWAEYAIKDEDIKYGNPLHNQTELKQAISDLVAEIIGEDYPKDYPYDDPEAIRYFNIEKERQRARAKQLGIGE